MTKLQVDFKFRSFYVIAFHSQMRCTACMTDHASSPFEQNRCGLFCICQYFIQSNCIIVYDVLYF